MLHLAKPPPLKPLSVNSLTIFRLPEPSLYRLISLTSPVVRLFESIVKGGICDHLYSHPSTWFCTWAIMHYTQMLISVDYWIKALEQRIPVDDVYIAT